MHAYVVVPLVVLSGALSLPASACSHSKLDLDWCGAAPRPEPPREPLYKPDFGREPSGPSLPNPRPTIVTPRDSRGRELHGPGVEWKF